MKPSCALTCAALILTLLLTGCETDGGLSARKEEKAATYTTLKVWQKRLIDQGTIANGFTPDMVYVAMGKPTKIETKDLPEGTAEMWTYSRYYPHVDAIHGFRHADFSTESAYQPQRPLFVQNSNSPNMNPGAAAPPPVGMGTSQTIFNTGGPQGGSMEPSGLRSYTIKVLFASGKVVRIGADENMN